MNERKLKQLFAAARNEPAPVPSEEFAADVLRAVRRERQTPAPETISLFDQLNRLFPRLAWAAAVVMVLSVAADYGLTAAGLPGLNSGLAQLSAQWLLTPNGF
jgi:hypothetical protein